MGTPKEEAIEKSAAKEEALASRAPSDDKSTAYRTADPVPTGSPRTRSSGMIDDEKTEDNDEFSDLGNSKFTVDEDMKGFPLRITQYQENGQMIRKANSAQKKML